MSEEENENPEIETGGDEGEELSSQEILQGHLDEINESFVEVGFLTRLKRMCSGLRQKRGTAEYKQAYTELQRLTAPLLAILCPILFIVILCVITEITGQAKRTIQIDIAQAEKNEETLEEEGEQQEVEQQEEMEVEIEVDVPSEAQTPVADLVVPTQTQTESAPRLPDPTSVALVKSPVTMKSIYGETRSAASRAAAMRKYGGDQRTEESVVNALRWLKMQQRPDGSWAGSTGADGQGLTGLVLLTYLSHGETGGGPEFGATVAKGLEWLMAHRENLDPVGTHALTEAWGFLKNPTLREPATEAVRNLADRLVATHWGPDDDAGRNTRPQLLRMAFQTMALKSARMSGIEPANLDAAFKKLKEGFMLQGNQKDGGFSGDYFGPPRANYRRTGIWHYMVGVIGLQYLGAGDDPIVEKTLKILDDDWEPPTLGSIDSSCCPVRGNYWATMVFFNGGGKRWANWNLRMIDVYFQGQTILRKAYTDSKGVKRNMGYWKCEDMHIGSQPIATTCWVAMQLMVYYRYLPTSKKEARGVRAKPAGGTTPKKAKKPAEEIEVEVNI